MRTVIDTRGVLRPGQRPYPPPPVQEPAPSAGVQTAGATADANFKDRLAWTGIGLVGAVAGGLIFKSLAAATGIGVAVVAGGMLLRDYNRARLFDDMHNR